jgi:anaerobic selenocysteine-containing dehydrogenase
MSSAAGTARRRSFLLAASAAATATAAALGIKTIAPRAVANTGRERSGTGLSDHARKYYRTTLV